MTARAQAMLERWAIDLPRALDAALEAPEDEAVRIPSQVSLERIGPAGGTGRLNYVRPGLAFDLQVTAEASVGYVGVQSPLLVGGGSGDGRGVASLDIALIRGEERLSCAFRYGLHPFSGRVRLEREAFLETLKRLLRDAGYRID
jgi:hypothetical protein